jgi:hypothetical protein
MKPRYIILFIVLLLLPSYGFAQGIGHGVELTLTSPKLVLVEPGKIVTASYLVSNRTDAGVELDENLDLPMQPEGWQPAIAYKRSISLAAGEQKVQLVTFIVPRKYPAGTYNATYSMINRNTAEIAAVESFSIVVKPVVKLDAVIEDKPELVLAGEAYDVRMRLINNGNSDVSMKMIARSSPEFPVVMDPVSVILAAGSSLPLNLSVKTDPAINTKTNHVLEIEVLAEAPDGGSTSLARTVFVEILPQLLASVDPRSRVPSQARFIAVGQNDETGAQLEYSGFGNLDEKGTRTVDFLFRGPDRLDRSTYGLRDVLRASYADENLSLTLGDKLYALSPLSELMAYARGAEAILHPGAAEIGSYYTETRWDAPQEREIAAFAGYRFGRAFKLRTNFLNKRRDDSPTRAGSGDDIYTIQARINPGSLLNLGLEYAHSSSVTGDESSSFAHRITLDGRALNRVWYTFENTYAAPDFPGYYRNVLYSNGTISAELHRNLRSSASYRFSENSLGLMRDLSGASREASYIGGLSYTFPTGTSASAEYETLNRRDKLAPAQYDFTQNTLRLGLGHTYRILGIQSYAERAAVESRLPGGEDRVFGNYSVYTYIRPSPTQSYTLFTRFGHNSFTGSPEKTVNIGASAWLKLRQRLTLNLSYQKNNIDSERLPLQDYAFSDIEYILPNSHSISLRMRWFKFENIAEEDYAFFAAYTVPFNIPAMKKRSFGLLKGTVIDRDQPYPVPMQNVVLSIGNVATMTNKRGEFMFPALAPGLHQLTIDQRSMGMNRIPSDGLPIPVEITGGRTTSREIGVSTAGEISGRVALLALDPAKISADPRMGAQQGLSVIGSRVVKQVPVTKDDLIDAGGLEEVIIELSNGEEHLYQKTDGRGKFSFKGLRPGAWKIRIDSQNLPPQHALETDEFSVTLAHGEKKEIAASVWPKPRSIQLLPGGTITGETKGEMRR